MRHVQNAVRTSDGAVRRETDDGVEYLVAPLIGLREMVYEYPRKGTSELLPAENIAATAEQWEGTPVRVGHPGQGPAPRIGEFRNPEALDGGEKLRGEAWIDVDRVNSLSESPHAGLGSDAQSIVDALDDGGTLEVSPGYDLLNDSDETPGRHNGRSYDAVQSEPVPDHVAIFAPDSKFTARCSPEQGCAVPRANGAPSTETQTLREAHMAPERSNAKLDRPRTPDYADTTSAGEWDAPSLGEYIEAFATEADQDAERVEDLSRESRQAIASKTLLGNPEADTAEDLRSFPVVTTSNALHEAALDAVLSRAPQAEYLSDDAVEQLQGKARTLLNEEFDRDIDRENASVLAHIRSLLFGESGRGGSAAGDAVDSDGAERAESRANAESEDSDSDTESEFESESAASSTDDGEANPPTTTPEDLDDDSDDTTDTPDADADPDDTNDTSQTMDDDKRIDVLVDKHGYDRENLEKLRDTDCLVRTYERFENDDSEDSDDPDDADPESDEDTNGDGDSEDDSDDTEDEDEAPTVSLTSDDYDGDIEITVDPADISGDTTAAEAVADRANARINALKSAFEDELASQRSEIQQFREQMDRIDDIDERVEMVETRPEREQKKQKAERVAEVTGLSVDEAMESPDATLDTLLEQHETAERANAQPSRGGRQPSHRQQQTSSANMAGVSRAPDRANAEPDEEELEQLMPGERGYNARNGNSGGD